MLRSDPYLLKKGAVIWGYRYFNITEKPMSRLFLCYQKRKSRQCTAVTLKIGLPPSIVYVPVNSTRNLTKTAWKRLIKFLCTGTVTSTYRGNNSIPPQKNMTKREYFVDVSADIFERGLCLPSGNKMTMKQVDKIITVIHKCFE